MNTRNIYAKIIKGFATKKNINLTVQIYGNRKNLTYAPNGIPDDKSIGKV